MLTAAAPVSQQNGTFAGSGIKQQIRSQLRRAGSNELDLRQFFIATGKPVTQYTVVAGAPVHFFLVRDDFKTFAHVHPKVGRDGRFSVPVALDADHRYYAFVDSFVQGVGEQVFRYTLQNGAPPHHLDVTLSKPEAASMAGPYRVVLSSARITAGKPTMLSATIYRGNQVAATPAHGSFDAVAALIDTGSLGYTALYEGGFKGMPSGHDYAHPQLPLPALKPGVYRMWLQFTIGSSQFTAPFTLAVQ